MIFSNVPTEYINAGIDVYILFPHILTFYFYKWQNEIVFIF